MLILIFCFIISFMTGIVIFLYGYKIIPVLVKILVLMSLLEYILKDQQVNLIRIVVAVIIYISLSSFLKLGVYATVGMLGGSLGLHIAPVIAPTFASHTSVFVAACALTSCLFYMLWKEHLLMFITAYLGATLMINAVSFVILELNHLHSSLIIITPLNTNGIKLRKFK